MEKKMGFFEAISQVTRKSFVFKGRARRKECQEPYEIIYGLSSRHITYFISHIAP